jgi:NAD(P)-dependent dehydrogenase (short-subunit alcohol dehydrogenase family)
MELKGRVAVITGAASGIGLAMAERFVAEGMSVVMADIEGDLLTSAADRLKSDGAQVLPFVCDVSDHEQVFALRDAALSAYGSVHLLCNNAGVATGRTNVKERPESWQWVIGVNVLGVAYGVSAFAKLMVEQGEGHIVNTASEAGLAASPMLGSYHAAKYAVVGLSESLHMELEATGVGVSCLCPELVDTKIFESTRNAPEALGFPKPGPIPIEQIASFMGTKAMDPRDVAGRVVYAVQANQFWIVTHQSTQRRLEHRNRMLETFQNPSYQA